MTTEAPEPLEQDGPAPEPAGTGPEPMQTDGPNPAAPMKPAVKSEAVPVPLLEPESPVQDPGAPQHLRVQPDPQAPAQAHGDQAAAAVGDQTGAGEDRPAVTTVEVDMVQGMIERCLTQYLSLADTMTLLKTQAKVEETFTKLVWEKLEEQNQDFFRAFYTRLKVKDQIKLFNHLLQQQIDIYNKCPGAPRCPGAPMAVGGPRPTMAPVFQNTPLQHSIMPLGTTDVLHHPTSSGGGSQGLNPHDFGLAEPDHPAGLHRTISELSLGAFNPPASPLRDTYLHHGADTHDMPGLPRNFSLSDLTTLGELEGGGMDGMMGGNMLGAANIMGGNLLAPGLGDLPRDFSMGELAQMEGMGGPERATHRSGSAGRGSEGRARTPSSPAMLLNQAQGSDEEAHLLRPPHIADSPPSPALNVHRG